MKRIRLSPRLRMAAELVPRSGRDMFLVDVGTDHAYLPVWLLQNQEEDRRFAGVIAADLRKGPLDRAVRTAREAGCRDRIDFRLCDGLSCVERAQAQVVVIAGMGGETIVHILKNAPWRDWSGITLILQPMSSMPQLRRWLGENGFCIRREELAREGETLYTAFLVQAGEMGTMTPAQLWAGRNGNGALRGEWLELWLERTRRALEGMARARGEDAPARKRELEKVLEGLVEMKEEWEQWQR